MSGLNYSDLTIEQSASSVLIKKGSEILSKIQNLTSSNLNYYDIVSTVTTAQSINGTSSDDILLGGSGNDTFTTGVGADVILGYSGNDDVTIDGVGDKTVDGGAGTNTATITYSGLTGLQDFPTRSLDSDHTLSLVDTSGNTITLKNILKLTVGAGGTGISVAGKDYIFTDHPIDTADSSYYRLLCTMHQHYAGSSRGVAVDATNKVFVSYSPDPDMGAADASEDRGCSVAAADSQQGGVGTNIYPLRADYSSTAMTVYGYSNNDYVLTSSQADTVYTYSGNDQVLGKAGADTIDLGSGDDVSFVTVADLSEDNIAGNSGNDTLNFGRVIAGSLSKYAAENVRSWTHDFGVTVNLGTVLADASKNISGFENMVGTEGADTLTGDGNNNVLIGGLGADTLSGGAGNDTIYDDINAAQSTESLWADLYGQYNGLTLSSYTDSVVGNDILNGNAGDDVLIASGGNDTLDGGVGADTLTGGIGIDTFVIRSGDGGSSIGDADTITDFTDGTDIIGMSGLNYSDLAIEQGTASYSSHVVVKKTSSGEFLTIIRNVSLSVVDDDDFSAI